MNNLVTFKPPAFYIKMCTMKLTQTDPWALILYYTMGNPKMDNLKHNGLDYSPAENAASGSVFIDIISYIFRIRSFVSRFVLLISVIYRCVFLLKINYRKTSRVKNFMFGCISFGNAKRVQFRFQHFVSILLNLLNGKYTFPDIFFECTKLKMR